MNCSYSASISSSVNFSFSMSSLRPKVRNHIKIISAAVAAQSIARFNWAYAAWLASLSIFFALNASAAPNIIVILTDDQRFDTIWAMPNVSQLATQGITFQQAYSTTPACVPARNSFLTGGFLPQANGVLDNSKVNGLGNSVGKDIQLLPVALQRAGYRTAIIGKGAGWAGDHVAPGWDFLREQLTDNYYLDVTFTEGSSTPTAPGIGQTVRGIPYVNDYIRDQSLAFLDMVAQQPERPFFMLLAPTSMHAPADPDPSGTEDGKFGNFIYRDRGYTETDLSDKPEWVADPTRKTFFKIPEAEEFHRNQLRTLHAADRVVGAVLSKLQSIGKSSETVVIFTSDNGYNWGEHGIYQKGNAFQESVVVPLIIRAPGVAPRKDTHLVAMNLDVPATILELANAKLDDRAPGVSRTTQGQSLVPLFTNAEAPWRDELLLEGHGSDFDGSHGAWEAVVSWPWKYVVHRSGAEEFYDRSRDPYELQSRADDPTVATLKASFAARANAAKGLTVRYPMWTQPYGRVGQAYTFSPTAWGGKAPYMFRVSSGSLPRGLWLNATTGVISGTPTVAGAYTFQLAVTDSSKSEFNGLPQRWVEKYKITVR